MDIGPRRGERGRPILRRNGRKIACPLLLFRIGRSPCRGIRTQRPAELSVVEARGIFCPLQVSTDLDCTETRAAAITGFRQGLSEIASCCIAQVRRPQLGIRDTVGVAPGRFILLALVRNLPGLDKCFFVVTLRGKEPLQLHIAGCGFRVVGDADLRARDGKGNIAGHLECTCSQRISIRHFRRAYSPVVAGVLLLLGHRRGVPCRRDIKRNLSGPPPRKSFPHSGPPVCRAPLPYLAGQNRHGHQAPQ